MKKNKRKLIKTKHQTNKNSLLTIFIVITLTLNSLIALFWVGLNNYCFDSDGPSNKTISRICSVPNIILNSRNLTTLPLTGNTLGEETDVAFSLFTVFFLASIIELTIFFLVSYPIFKGIKHWQGGKTITKVQ